ncbi:tetratricopeptide repeat protein [Hallella multisaccharivorax]|uniref:tetratricopeptide repeat protein n=1 Tax=Hallella multisaccharivorax TaxID=310514 RepID=UPI003623B1BC
MDIAHLIHHPEQLDRDTLYELRGLLALYPYFQSARLLLLQNLFLLHDPTFNEELRQAALYITDRRVIFDLVEAGHYQLPKARKEPKAADTDKLPHEDRTISLIDDFLDSIPEEDRPDKQKRKRKPTPADAAIDYVSYLLETEDEEERNEERRAPQMKGQSLIDDFINHENGKIKLKEEPEYKPIIEEDNAETGNHEGESYFTETLAKIYIKQGRYEKALEIIQRLNLNYPKKNTYFADQIRFLEKLILNDKNKKQ